MANRTQQATQKKKAMLAASPIPSEVIRTQRRFARRDSKNISQKRTFRLQITPIFLFFGAKSEVIMPEVEKMFSVKEILQSKQFQNEAPSQLKFVIRKVHRETDQRKVKSIQKANQPKKVA
ncbi:MAG: hypothetical protein K1X72_16890 [Pyrinomonadaceae bacterium]|nr:hypothetical protein [Pyrinomonadaceae bacterium]